MELPSVVVPPQVEFLVTKPTQAATITVFNPYTSAFTFYIKCTEPSLFEVHPVSGTLPAQTSRKVIVSISAAALQHYTSSSVVVQQSGSVVQRLRRSQALQQQLSKQFFMVEQFDASGHVRATARLPVRLVREHELYESAKSEKQQHQQSSSSSSSSGSNGDGRHRKNSSSSLSSSSEAIARDDLDVDGNVDDDGVDDDASIDRLTMPSPTSSSSSSSLSSSLASAQSGQQRRSRSSPLRSLRALLLWHLAFALCGAALVHVAVQQPSALSHALAALRGDDSTGTSDNTTTSADISAQPETLAIVAWTSFAIGLLASLCASCVVDTCLWRSRR